MADKDAKEVLEDTDGVGNILSRDELLVTLSDIIKATKAKVINGRVRDPTHERIKTEILRACAYSIHIYSSILKDREISDIERRITELEQNGKH